MTSFENVKEDIKHLISLFNDDINMLNIENNVYINFNPPESFNM